MNPAVGQAAFRRLLSKKFTLFPEAFPIVRQVFELKGILKAGPDCAYMTSDRKRDYLLIGPGKGIVSDNVGTVQVIEDPVIERDKNEVLILELCSVENIGELP